MYPSVALDCDVVKNTEDFILSAVSFVISILPIILPVPSSKHFFNLKL